MRTHHGLYYDSRIKLLLILLTSALAFALGGGLTGLLLFNPSNPFIFCDNFLLLIKDFNHCARFEHLNFRLRNSQGFSILN